MRSTGDRRRASDSLRRKGLIGGLLLAFVCSAGTHTAAQVSYGEATAPDGTTPLHQAVRQNDIKTADALIKRGADVKATTRYGVTPIGLAALNGNAAMLRRLLDAGADPDTATPGGETALMTAARTGNVDAVTLLLDRKANVNAKDTARAQTALMWAVTENHPDIVKLLAAQGATSTRRRSSRYRRVSTCPRAQAERQDRESFVSARCRKADGGMSPLLFAVRDGNTEMTRLLLELGADIKQTSGNHTSPLLIALLNGQVTHGAGAAREGRRSQSG